MSFHNGTLLTLTYAIMHHCNHRNVKLHMFIFIITAFLPPILSHALFSTRLQELERERGQRKKLEDTVALLTQELEQIKKVRETVCKPVCSPNTSQLEFGFNYRSLYTVL